MKYFIIIILSSFVLNAHSQCRIAEIVSQHKAGFEKPYKYDGFNYFKIEFSETPDQTITREFIAFKGQQYQLLFCTSGFEERVRINIYNAADHSLIAGTVVGSEVNVWSFFCKQTGTYTIEYMIPASETGVLHDGCIAMLIGFHEQ